MRGTHKHTKTSATKNAVQPLPVNKGSRLGNSIFVKLIVVILSLRTPTLHGKNTLWAFLDEDDDEHEHTNLGKHGTGHSL